MADDVAMGEGIVIKGPTRLSVNVKLRDFTLLNVIMSIGHDVRLGIL